MGQPTVRKFLIATHGHLATGVKSSLDVIIGETENLFLVEAYTEKNKGIEDDLTVVLDDLLENEELIVFTDLLGGSITNQVVRFTQGRNVHVVAGFSLALLIEVLMADRDSPVAEVIEAAIVSAKQQLVYVNKLIAPANDSDHD